MNRAHNFPTVASTAMLAMYLVVSGLLGLPATGIAGAGDSLTCTLECSHPALRWIPVLNDYDPTHFLVRLTATNNTGMNLSDLSFEIEWTDPSGLDLLELDPVAPDNDRVRRQAVLLAGSNLSAQWVFRLRAQNNTGGIVRIPFSVRYTASELGVPLSPFETAEVEIWPVSAAILQCSVTAPDSIRFVDGQYDAPQFDVELRIQNTGNETARNVRAFLLQSAGFTAVSPSMKAVGDIDAGDSTSLIGQDAFRLEPMARVVDGWDTIRVLVIAENGQNEVVHPVWIERAARPQLEVHAQWSGSIVYDGSSNDYRPNPITVPVRVRNVGDGTARNVMLRYTAVAAITPFEGDGSVEIGDLEPGAEFEYDWMLLLHRRDVAVDVPLEFSAECDGGAAVGTVVGTGNTSVHLPPARVAELQCEIEVQPVQFDPQVGSYVPNPFFIRARARNLDMQVVSGLVARPLLQSPRLSVVSGPSIPRIDSLAPGQWSPWIEWLVRLEAGPGDSLGIGVAFSDQYNVMTLCQRRVWVPATTLPGLQMACESELYQLRVDSVAGRYEQDRFKVRVSVANNSGRSVFNVRANVLSMHPGLRIGDGSSQLLTPRLDHNDPVVQAEWEILAGPQDADALAELRFMVTGEDAQGNPIQTIECAVYIQMPRMPLPVVACMVRTDVTNPPDDITIAWDMNTSDYEGTKSAFGSYSVITVTATVTNTGGGQVNRLRASLLLPENMALDNDEQAIKLTQPSDLAPGEMATASWKVRVIGGCLHVERSLEVLVTSEQGAPTRCSQRIIIAEKPCIVSLDLPDDVVGVTASTVVVPVFFRSGAIEPLQRYRLMIGFDQVHISFLDAIAEGSRTEDGWRGPRATVLPDPADNRRAFVLVDDLTLHADAAIDLGEEGVLVFLRFQVAFDPEFTLSGNGNVTQSDLEFQIDVTLDGNRRILGSINSAEESQYGTVMLAYSPGMVTVTSPCAWPLQWTARLGGNHPNPFNPSTTVTYTLDAPMPVTLTVMDIFGREIRVIDSGTRSAGRHDIVFDAGDLPGGVYLYRLQTPSGSAIRRMLLLR